MGEIPEDIDKTASDIVRTDYSKTDDEPDYMLYRAIAEALLAERNRCAEACKLHIKYPCVGKEDEIETGTAEIILDAIINP